MIDLDAILKAERTLDLDTFVIDFDGDGLHLFGKGRSFLLKGSQEALTKLRYAAGYIADHMRQEEERRELEASGYVPCHHNGNCECN